VVAQSGCLACHRLGQDGNHGPGPGLTHIGSMLSRHGIEHALINPSAPMPSFKHLPAAKLKAVAEFLSELR
jgi:menaquinol-cytochrome c reductase cytochrome b/c subunit